MNYIMLLQAADIYFGTFTINPVSLIYALTSVFGVLFTVAPLYALPQEDDTQPTIETHMHGDAIWQFDHDKHPAC